MLSENEITVTTDDPFQENIERNLWFPTVTYNPLNEDSINKLINSDYSKKIDCVS